MEVVRRLASVGRLFGEEGGVWIDILGTSVEIAPLEKYEIENHTSGHSVIILLQKAGIQLCSWLEICKLLFIFFDVQFVLTRPIHENVSVCVRIL